jgi:hypothetical protein
MAANGLLTNGVIVCVFLHNLLHNVSATVSYDQKELLGIRTAITHLVLDKYFFFNESELLQTMRQGPNHRHSHEEEMKTPGT